MITIYRLLHLIFFFLLINPLIRAQDFVPLVKATWKQSKELQARSFELQKAESAFLEAKALYRPTVNFGTQYTLAYGGRSIALPIGDLFNPVYNTLNQLTGTNNFGSLENVETQFLPNNFYDARLRVQQPIYYPEISVNKSIHEEKLKLQQLEVKAYKRLLSKELMTTLFQYKSAEAYQRIISQTDTLLTEAVRTTSSMIRNGIALPSALHRIESERASLEAKKLETEAIRKNAFNYLSFLMGPEVENLISQLVLTEFPELNKFPADDAEELEQLKSGIKINELLQKKENQFYRPRLGAQLDLGSQEFDFGFDPYVLLGINLEINLYDGARHKLRKDQNKSAIAAIQSRHDHLKDQFGLRSASSLNNLESARAQANTFAPRIDHAKKLYQEIFKKYKEGSVNYLELLDAQTQLFRTETEYSLSRFQVWIRWAEHLYNTANFPID
ncbi:MAG TPA: TolC family protein [Saprospiraceae bacterium]|nr:TolC family protein [Saprospiraceae bacterium]